MYKYNDYNTWPHGILSTALCAHDNIVRSVLLCWVSVKNRNSGCLEQEKKDEKVNKLLTNIVYNGGMNN